MSTVNIEVGSKLDLVSMAKTKAISDTKVYKSQILDMADERHFQIATPVEGYKVLLLPVGGKYEVTIYAGKTIYVCQVKIMARYKTGNQYVMDVEAISSPKRFQRRAYYRLEYTKDFEFHLPEEDEEEDEISGDIIEELEAWEDIDEEEDAQSFDRGILLDLSGGGCRFVSREKIEPGERLILRIPLEMEEMEEEKILTVVGKTLASRELENRGRGYEQRVEFTEIENEQREEIIKFIFQQERKNRKKGKK